MSTTVTSFDLLSRSEAALRTPSSTEDIHLLRFDGSLLQTVAYMVARGSLPEEIEKATNLTPAQVGILLRQEDVKSRAREIMLAEKDLDPRMPLRSLIPDAIQALADIVRDPKAGSANRIAAAKEILSRTMGNIPLGSKLSEEKLPPVQEYAQLQRQLSACLPPSPQSPTKLQES